MNKSFFIFFSLLLPLSPLLAKKQKKTKAKIVKKKPAVKKSKKGKKSTTSSKPRLTPLSPKSPSPTKQPPSSSIVPLHDSSSKTQPVTFAAHQTPKTSLLQSSNSSLSKTPPSSHLLLSPLTKASSHAHLPQFSDSNHSSAILSTGATDLQKTGAEIQQETLHIIQKIEPLLAQNTTNLPFMKKLTLIKTIIIENKPLPKSFLISFAPDKQKITGISKEAYTELYRGLLDYYKNTPVPTNTPPQSLSNPAPISSPIASPSMPPIPNISSTIVSPEPLIPQIPLEEKHSSLINTTYETISTQPSTLPTPLVKKESLVINNTTSPINPLPSIPLKRQEPSATPNNVDRQKTPLKQTTKNKSNKKKSKKNNNNKSENETIGEQNTSTEKENKKKLNNELITLEAKGTSLDQRLDVLINEKKELELFLKQKIESMNQKEKELKNTEEEYDKLKKEYDRAIPLTKSFLGIDQEKKNNMEAMKKTLEREKIKAGDLQEESTALKLSIETLKNNIAEKENEIREQLIKINLNKNTIALITKEKKVS